MQFTSATKPPVSEGRYCTLVSHTAVPELAMPYILTWHMGAWYYPESSVKYPYFVFGYSELLPVGKIVDLFPDQKPNAPGKYSSTRVEIDEREWENELTKSPNMTWKEVDPATIPQEYDI